MKFPRNARIFRGQLDVAPFAAVFFLLVIFLLLASLLYTPGVRLELPMGGDLPGVEGETISVAVDSSGRLYFENQWIRGKELRVSLRKAVTHSATPPTLIVHMDKRVTYDQQLHLGMLAREAGISHTVLATLPNPLSAPE